VGKWRDKGGLPWAHTGQTDGKNIILHWNRWVIKHNEDIASVFRQVTEAANTAAPFQEYFVNQWRERTRWRPNQGWLVTERCWSTQLMPRRDEIQTLDVNDVVMELIGQQRLRQLSQEAFQHCCCNVHVAQLRKVHLDACKNHDGDNHMSLNCHWTWSVTVLLTNIKQKSCLYC